MRLLAPLWRKLQFPSIFIVRLFSDPTPRLRVPWHFLSYFLRSLIQIRVSKHMDSFGTFFLFNLSRKNNISSLNYASYESKYEDATSAAFPAIL
jgi:hypothetical protein